MTTTELRPTPLLDLNSTPDHILDIIWPGEKRRPELVTPTDQSASNTCEYTVTIINKSNISFTYLGVEIGSGSCWVSYPQNKIIATNKSISFGGDDAFLATAILNLSASFTATVGRVTVKLEALAKVPLTGSNTFKLTFSPGGYFFTRQMGEPYGWSPNITWTIYNT